jgi:hypothetical protein
MDTTITKLEPLSKQIVSFGQAILMDMFKYHKLVRSELLEQILSRLIAKSDNVPYFVALLSSIVKESPQLILEHIQKVPLGVMCY